MQKYGEIKDLVNAVLESYDKYPVIQNIDCRSRINSRECQRPSGNDSQDPFSGLF